MSRCLLTKQSINTYKLTNFFNKQHIHRPWTLTAWFSNLVVYWHLQGLLSPKTQKKKECLVRVLFLYYSHEPCNNILSLMDCVHTLVPLDSIFYRSYSYHRCLSLCKYTLCSMIKPPNNTFLRTRPCMTTFVAQPEFSNTDR